MSYVFNPFTGNFDAINAAMSPLDFPAAGLTKSYHWQGAITPSSTAPILNISTGNSGVVRSISIVLSDDLVGLADLTLNIKYDGEGSPSVSVPLRSLIGYETWHAVIPDLVFKTPFFEIHCRAKYGDSAIAAPNVFTLKYQIPYTNGINIYLSAASLSSHSAWINTIYQNQIASQNSNLRLFIDRSNENLAGYSHKTGTCKFTSTSNFNNSTNVFSSGDVGKVIIPDLSQNPSDVVITAYVDQKNVTVSTVDTESAQINVSMAGGFNLSTPHTLMNRAAPEKGWVVALFAGFVPASLDFTGFLEGNPRIFLNGNLDPDLEWTGTEDMPNAGFYFCDGFQGDEGGLTCYDDGGLDGLSAYAGQITFYKLFKNSPLRYTNGIKGTYPNLDALAVQMNWTAVGYREF